VRTRIEVLEWQFLQPRKDAIPESVDDALTDTGHDPNAKVQCTGTDSDSRENKRGKDDEVRHILFGKRNVEGLLNQERWQEGGEAGRHRCEAARDRARRQRERQFPGGPGPGAG